ncbi:MAG: hypothetical protein HYW57_03950 [Ignavibacteriales bacterium]|nr:hypothetical protein [Ignavibacteriales bacterium]
MERYLEKATAFFDIPLDLRTRVLIFIAALTVVPVFSLPLWTMRFESPRYPEGLGMEIYAHRLIGANDTDLMEINALNHYLGMPMVDEKNLSQFLWFPFLLGVTIMLCFRVIVLGRMSKLVDLFFLYVYSVLFALWSFRSTLYSWGHTLNPFATVKIEPFTPPLWGYVSVAEIDVYSAPGVGVIFLVAIPLLLVAGILISRKTWLKDHQPKRDYIS